MKNDPEPFTIAIPDERLTFIRDRVAAFDWDGFPDAGGWSGGIAMRELRRIADYWLGQYDWRRQETRLNQWPQFRAEVDGHAIHFLHVRGSGPPGRLPVLLVHGWPSSFIEYEAAAERLAWPERFGGDAVDGRDIVIPSLPGYGFSDAPGAPLGARRVASILDGLMCRSLGYSRYIAQGSDWGSIICSWIAHDHAASCAGLHVKLATMKVRGIVPENTNEHAYLAKVRDLAALETGYSAIQSTRPQTLGFALADSPLGAAAWILEKFAAWSDLPRRDGAPVLEAVYTLDQVLTNVMLYVATGRMVSSTWLYFGSREEASRELEHRVAVPTAVAVFRDPVFPAPPRSLANRSFNVVQWTEMPRGGHFAAMEQPDLFADDVQRFARLLEG